jgi:hypothetical protein
MVEARESVTNAKANLSAKDKAAKTPTAIAGLTKSAPQLLARFVFCCLTMQWGEG